MTLPPGFLPADWPAPEGIIAGTTLRTADGVSATPFDAFNLGAHCGDDPAAVVENRRRLEGMLNLPAPPCWLRQVHGVHVERIEHPLEQPPEADASVTDQRELPLVILTADCLPVLLCSRHGEGDIAAAHAGWRGLAAGVLQATVHAMHSDPEDLLAWLGPAAGPTAYEVGEEVRDAFLAHGRNAASAFQPTRPGHWLVDLHALSRQALGAAGVRHIHGGGHCTITDSRRFFSHRRDGRGGRMASLIWRR